MLFYVYLLLLLELVIAQKQSFRGGNRYAPIPYYNLGPKPSSGVGVLQDLSNARILSNEPFIISFEFPKLLGSGDSRKARFGSKRTKSQRKKNRKPRQFRHIVVPEEDLLQKKKYLPFLRRPPGLEDLKVPNLISDDRRTGKNIVQTEDDAIPSDRSNYARVMNWEKPTMENTEERPVNADKPEITEQQESDDEMESVHQKNWENIKKQWASLFSKQKEGEDNVVDGEGDANEERIKAMSRKMWANCQLHKLLNAPQRNPHFYKLLPPNYQALIMNDEKQLECNQFYDIIDLAKDKKMITEKIEQLERILTPRNDSGMRRKREAPAEEVKSEEENTLQDETLQGKAEGEVRSDRSKRTKERQHIRRQRSKEFRKEKIKRVHRAPKKGVQAKNKEKVHGEIDGDRKDSVNEVTTNKVFTEHTLKPEEDEPEKKREKQEIRSGKDSNLQNVFSPSEVSKVIRQKEMEATVFDRVLRAMKKFEENNSYDESFSQHKRESGNNTEIPVVQKNDSSEDGWELEDTIRKLAKIFKILGVKAEAAKKIVEESEDGSSEESTVDGKKVKGDRVGKSPKCTCAECPFCQDCFKCFKECRKAVIAAKNSGLNNQTPVSSAHTGKGSIDKDSKNEMEDTANRQEEQVSAGEHSNDVKIDRMYRSKLPPSRDLVRVYFDNPENKLLVWTKRGRRTMPWGSLASDLQLYRDRARQILKSAEDILHRIRDTEDKLHNDHYGENENSDSMKNMDDIIKKVVNEGETKNMLRTPWEAELEKGVLDGDVVRSNQISKNMEGEPIYNIFKDGVRERTELPKESLTMDDADNEKKTTESGESYEIGRVEAAEPKADTPSETAPVKEETDGEMDNKSVEAAVLPVEKEEVMTQRINLNDFDSEKSASREEPEEISAGKKENEEEEEDVPAKVEAISQDIKEKPVSKNESEETDRKQVVEYMKKALAEADKEKDESQEEEKSVSDESEKVKNAFSDESRSVEDRHDDKSETYSEETQLKQAHNENSFEEEKSYSRESQEAREQSAESYNDKKDSENVEKTSSDDARPKSAEEVERAFSEESEEPETTFSGESESVEKAREHSYESEDQDVELRATGNDEERNVRNENEDLEKNAENLINELKKAVNIVKEEKTNRKEEVEKTEYEKEASEEEYSYEDGETVERKETDTEEELEDTEEVKPEPAKEEKHLEDHIKSIEESYIIKGVKQTKEEKDAILKALLNVEKKEGMGEEAVEEIQSAMGEANEEVKQEESDDSLKTVVQHLERGHMDEKDFEVINKLNESQIDHLVGEMQKNDEKGTSVNCETQMKLCQAICSCSKNGTSSDMDKYEIMKVFLGWLKDLNMEKMVPISA